MTEEQIKQNAEVYANTLRIGGLSNSPKLIARVSFEEGAHSRDEEIEKWKNLCDRLTIEKWILQEKLHNLDN